MATERSPEAGCREARSPEASPGTRFLEVRALLKRFGGGTALGPLDLELDRGEHLAVCGPSGSGKTTLLRLLAGLLQPSEGEIRVAGTTVNRPGWSEPPHRRDTGMLFQELALWPHLTVLEQVELGVAPRIRGKDRRHRAESMLAQLGLEKLARRFPAELSGGERQRVAWGRATVGEPRLLLLDEPLTSLDPRLQGELLEAIERYGAQPERTVVVVTHDTAVAERLGRRRLDLSRSSR